jgi:hypothetical protein
VQTASPNPDGGVDHGIAGDFVDTCILPTSDATTNPVEPPIRPLVVWTRCLGKIAGNVEVAGVIKGQEAPFTGMLTSGIRSLEEKNGWVVSFVPACCVNLTYDAKSIIVDFQAAAHLQSHVDGLQHLPAPLLPDYGGGE